jgi:hypothetical protein
MWGSIYETFETNEYNQYDPSDDDLEFVPTSFDHPLEPSLPADKVIEPPPVPAADPVPYDDPDRLPGLTHMDVSPNDF